MTSRSGRADWGRLADEGHAVLVIPQREPTTWNPDRIEVSAFFARPDHLGGWQPIECFYTG